MSITGDLSLFTVYHASEDGPAVKFGDGVVQRTVVQGSIVLCSDWLPTSITLTDVLYIPHCPVNLLSVNAWLILSACVWLPLLRHVSQWEETQQAGRKGVIW